jgi:DNA-binding response OmpR family regulator
VISALERAFKGVVVARAASVARAEELATGAEWSVAIVDHQLPDGAGLRVLDKLREANPSLPVVMLTGIGAEETAIEAFRHGASDYVVKGAAFLDALTVRVRELVAA